MLTWGDWVDHSLGHETPYVEWFDILHTDRSGYKPEFVRQIVPRAPDKFSSLENGSSALRSSIASDESVAEPGSETPGPYVIRSPEFMTNQTFADWWENRPDPDSWLPSADTFDYPTVDPETVVIGIIDTGLALGHRRFRLHDGRTRVLGTWLQGAPVNAPGLVSEPAPYLPFGRHLFEQQINGAFQQFSTEQNLHSPLDQDGFNRATGLTHFQHPEAERTLAGHASHGTHVMGLAGGVDPDSSHEREFGEKVRFLLVSLPPALAFGEGGTFLDFYLIYAVRWLIEVNAKIAEKSGFDKPRPMVINASFGKHAGSKDGAQPFVNAMLHHHQNGRGAPKGVDEVTGRVPFHAVLPAGNSNLDQATAKFMLSPTGATEAEFDWVVQPDDDTSNFLEIWYEEDAQNALTSGSLAIELVPPGQQPVGEVSGAADQICELTKTHPNGEPNPLARIYCQNINRPQSQQSSDEGPQRFRYLVCLAPDRYRSDKWTNPPAGRWKVRFRNLSTDASLSVSVMVQTDQPVDSATSVARASYLDDPTYAKFSAGGRICDSYEYGYQRGSPPSVSPENLDNAEYVKRHGSLNSYAANSGVATIAGYRSNDGRPATYSSTGSGKKDGPKGRGAPTAAFPTDDGYAHPGILSDGASDGSIVAMRGTSFASALATREVAKAWLSRQHDPYGQIPINQLLEVRAQGQPVPQGWFKCPVKIEKVGAGRIVCDSLRRGLRR